MIKAKINWKDQKKDVTFGLSNFWLLQIKIIFVTLNLAGPDLEDIR